MFEFYQDSSGLMQLIRGLNLMTLMRSFKYVKFALLRRWFFLCFFFLESLELFWFYARVVVVTWFPLQERKKMLQCSCCGKLVHSACLMPPIGDIVPEEWSCHLCKEKTDEYLQARQAYIAEIQKRYTNWTFLKLLGSDFDGFMQHNWLEKKPQDTLSLWT